LKINKIIFSKKFRNSSKKRLR